MKEYFRRFSRKAAEMVGAPWSFVTALAVIVIWALSGPIYHFSDTWQLVINTATTIITFLMVFLIQNTQNRDAKALHLKLDELIRVVEKARNNLVDLEDLSDEELAKLEAEFRRFREQNSHSESRMEVQEPQNTPT
jgi:low affinity Fe/Cu permease